MNRSITRASLAAVMALAGVLAFAPHGFAQSNSDLDKQPKTDLPAPSAVSPDKTTGTGDINPAAPPADTWAGGLPGTPPKQGGMAATKPRIPLNSANNGGTDSNQPAKPSGQSSRAPSKDAQTANATPTTKHGGVVQPQADPDEAMSMPAPGVTDRAMALPPPNQGVAK